MKNWVKNNNFCVVTYIDPEPWKEKCWTPWWIFCWRTAMQPLLALLWVCIEQVSNAIAYFTKTFKVHFLGLNYFKWADNCTRRSEMESFKGLIPLQFVYINTFSNLFGAFHYNMVLFSYIWVGSPKNYHYTYLCEFSANCRQIWQRSAHLTFRSLLQ